jgi:hypothetical protein
LTNDTVSQSFGGKQSTLYHVNYRSAILSSFGSSPTYELGCCFGSNDDTIMLLKTEQRQHIRDVVFFLTFALGIILVVF